MKDFFKKILRFFMSLPRIVSLRDVRPSLTRKQTGKIVLSLGLNLVRSVSQLLAPLALSQSMLLLAQGEKTTSLEVGSLEIEFSAPSLLYLFCVFSGWTLLEESLRRKLLLDSVESFNNTLARQLIVKPHTLSIQGQTEIRDDLITIYFSLQEHYALLPDEIVNHFFSSFSDLSVGTLTIWFKFGKIMGIEFLVYALLNIFLYHYYILYQTELEKRLTESKKENNDAFEHAYDILSQPRLVRLSNQQNQEIALSTDYFFKANATKKRYYEADIKHNCLSQLPQAITPFLVVFYLLRYFSRENKLTALFLLLYLMIHGHQMNRFNQSVKKIMSMLGGLDEIQTILDKKTERVEFNESGPSLTDVVVEIDPSHEIAIEFEQVIFGYNKEKPFLNLTFQINKNETIAIVGPSNSGKSTLIDLLFGFCTPLSGKIKIHGMDIARLPLDQRRSFMAYANQTPALFRKKTIKKNICYGLSTEKHSNKTSFPTPRSSLPFYELLDTKQTTLENEEEDLLCEKLMRQSELIHLWDSRNQCRSLSVGEAQRVELARIFNKEEALIFVFDEPTASLDSSTEQNVLDALAKLTRGKTTIMIAHRLNTIKRADRILVLSKEGTIAEIGTHEELLKNKKGLYYRDWKIQSSEDKEEVEIGKENKELTL